MAQGEDLFIYSTNVDTNTVKMQMYHPFHVTYGNKKNVYSIILLSEVYYSQ